MADTATPGSHLGQQVELILAAKNASDVPCCLTQQKLFTFASFRSRLAQRKEFPGGAN